MAQIGDINRDRFFKLHGQQFANRSEKTPLMQILIDESRD